MKRCEIKNFMLTAALLLVLSGCAQQLATTTPTPIGSSPAPGAVPTAIAAVASTTATVATLPSPLPIRTPTVAASAVPTAAPVAWPAAYPIGRPGAAPGDGFFIRHGYAVENTWFNPGYWHTGEDWYALDGDTAGAQVYAIAAGDVVYVGANYPGRVIIVRHGNELFSMYGHLDPAVTVAVGEAVARGTLLGVVLRRSDQTPNHLHFEIRTFLTEAFVNGAQPRYDFRCGRNCPPGPGYWPIGAPDHPGERGWRNPTHVINSWNTAAAGQNGASVLVPTQPLSPTLTLWSAPPGGNQSPQPRGELALRPGATLALLAIDVGPADERGTGAGMYQLWYEVQAADGRRGWVQAAVATRFETGSDGRAATVRFNLLPQIGR